MTPPSQAPADMAARGPTVTNPSLTSAAALCTVGALQVLWDRTGPRMWLGAMLAAVLIGGLWYVRFNRGTSVSARIRITLTAMYATGLALLASRDLAPGALVCLTAAPLFALLALSARAARGLLFLSLTVWGAATALHPDDTWRWLEAGVLGAAVAIPLAMAILHLTRELAQQTLERQQLAERLEAEARARDVAQTALTGAQERLVHAHKLEAVGRLSGGIAHDFNNTLTVILSYAELLKSRLGRDQSLSELTSNIIQAAEQGGDLAKQLLSFSRRQPVKPRVVDVRELLKGAERSVVRLVPKGVRLTRLKLREELHVNVDPTLLQQAILNLALNARDAMPQGGELTLEAEGVSLASGSGMPLVPGSYVAIRVRDTGTGMSAETAARIFEPFFTTKEPGRGTGLGLSNVRETVEGAGGHVQVESTPGRGSTFTILLPRAQARVSGVEERNAARPEAALLVVDDEPQIRDVICAMLTEAGYEAHSADSAQTALRMLSDGAFDLVCTDMVMPDMPGGKLVEEVRTRHPALPILVCSAYGVDDALGQRVASGEVAFLSKPFTRRSLLEAVERALQRRSSGNHPFVAG